MFILTAAWRFSKISSKVPTWPDFCLALWNFGFHLVGSFPEYLQPSLNIQHSLNIFSVSLILLVEKNNIRSCTWWTDSGVCTFEGFDETVLFLGFQGFTLKAGDASFFCSHLILTGICHPMIALCTRGIRWYISYTGTDWLNFLRFGCY